MGTQGRRINEVGNRYGRLLVRSFSGIRWNKAMWDCLCDCGNESTVAGVTLRSGVVVSCGCFNKEVTIERCLIHGHARAGKTTSEYSIYHSMIQRCYNPKDKDFENYGGRGIKVCQRWLNSFQNFLADIGPRPRGMSIERRNNYGNYELENCVWASRVTQANNTRRNRVIEYGGVAKTLAQWAFEIGLSSEALHTRIKRGWELGRVLKTKPMYGQYFSNPAR